MTITVKLLNAELDACQCPVCGGDMLHEPNCAIKDVEHVRISPFVVDWNATFKKNGITVNRNPTAERRKR